MIHIVKGFSVVIEAEVHIFLEFPCFLHDPANVSNLIFGPSASLKPSLYIWKFSVHILLKSSLKDFKYNLASMSEKAMAAHSSTLAWTTPWTEEPCRLQSTGSRSRTRPSDFPSLSCQSAQSLSHVRLSVTPWTAAHQAAHPSPASSLLRLMSTESVSPVDGFNCTYFRGNL